MGMCFDRLPLQLVVGQLLQIEVLCSCSEGPGAGFEGGRAGSDHASSSPLPKHHHRMVSKRRGGVWPALAATSKRAFKKGVMYFAVLCCSTAALDNNCRRL